MDEESLERRLKAWFDAQEPDSLICFQCKGEPDVFLFPDDFAWGPVLLCKKCRRHLDARTRFATDQIDGPYH